MNFLELFFLAFGLAMDAFAVSVCKGLSIKKLSIRKMITVGLWFGGFQAIMPLSGFFLGTMLEKYILSFDHIVSFILLSFIGLNMIKSSLSDNTEIINESLDFKTMFGMSVATSIDSLAVGVTFSLIPNIDITFCILTIGIITCFLSVLGVKIGNIFGIKYKSKAEFAGGITLIIIGTKILIQHLIEDGVL